MPWKDIPNRPYWQFKDDPVIINRDYLGRETSRLEEQNVSEGVIQRGENQFYVQTRYVGPGSGVVTDNANRGEISATFYNKEVKPASFFSSLPVSGVQPFGERAFTYALTSETDPTSASWTTKQPAGYTYYPGEGIGADAPITDMSSMFQNNLVFNQDISSWDVSSVTNMNFMFYNASVFDQDISGWNVLAASVAPGNSTPPSGFDTGTPGTWTTAEKPQWGTDGT